MCNKAHALKCAPNRYKTQEIRIKAVDKYPSIIKYVPDQ